MKRKETKVRKFKNYTNLFTHDPELAQFRQTVVDHPVFLKCEETILSKIAHPVSFNIVPVVGPSGVGKTQLLNEVVAALLRVDSTPQITSDQTTGNQRSKQNSREQTDKDEKAPYLPVIFVVAKNGRTFESRYKSLLVEILEQANEVLVTIGKVSPSGAIEAPNRTKSKEPLVVQGPVSLSSLPISRLEALVKSALKGRRVRAVLIDEAQHLAPLVQQEKGYGPELYLIADGLKLLGQNSGTLIVLFGTAELLSLPNLSGQLGRRSQLTHFRRYRWDDPLDRQYFESVVTQFAKEWPALLPQDLLVKKLPFLYTGCLGCIGILSDWLAAAMHKARKEQLGSVTYEILKETALRGPRIRKIHSEAQKCEEAFANEKIGPEDLINEVCGEESEVNGAESNGKSGEEGASQIDKTKKGPPKQKPGKRSPTYDAFEPQKKAA